MKENICIITGEVSGNIYASYIIKHLKEKTKGNIHFWGIGGDEMSTIGFENIYHIDELSIIGLHGILKNLKKIVNMKKNLIKLIKERKPKGIIFIDSPGFNLPLSKKTKKLGFKNIYIVSPQIWAWNYKRIKDIKQNIDLMLTLYKFEVEIYKKENIKALWIGHPIIDSIPDRLSQEQEPILPKNGKKNILFLPGSRVQEAEKLMPIYKDVFLKIQDKYNLYISYSNPKLEDIIQKYTKDTKVLVFFKNPLKSIKKADVVVACSGTVTLEVAYFEKPMVIVYKVSPLTFFIGKRIVRIPYIGMVNILYKDFLVKELLQRELTSENIIKEIKRILEDKEYRSRMLKGFKKIKEELGNGDATRKAADYIVQELDLL